MPWVTFTQDFDWRPEPRVMTAYKAGYSGQVTTRCAEEAIAKGVAYKKKIEEGMKLSKSGKPVPK